MNTRDRKAIYDIYCENEHGEKFIVELQKSKQDYFKERTVFYATFPIREQADTGIWDFSLKAVYCIGILDFVFRDYKKEEHSEKAEFIHEIKLKDQHCNVFYEKLTFIYVEMPNFHKKENELVTRMDKWFYFIQHLESFSDIPDIFKDDMVFKDTIKRAAIARMDDEQQYAYEMSLKHYRDINNVIASAARESERIGELRGEKKGEKKGERKGILKVAKSLKDAGMPVEFIKANTGLTKEEIKNL